MTNLDVCESEMIKIYKITSCTLSVNTTGKELNYNSMANLIHHLSPNISSSERFAERMAKMVNVARNSSPKLHVNKIHNNFDIFS